MGYTQKQMEVARRRRHLAHHTDVLEDLIRQQYDGLERTGVGFKKTKYAVGVYFSEDDLEPQLVEYHHSSRNRSELYIIRDKRTKDFLPNSQNQYNNQSEVALKEDATLCRLSYNIPANTDIIPIGAGEAGGTTLALLSLVVKGSVHVNKSLILAASLMPEKAPYEVTQPSAFRWGPLLLVRSDNSDVTPQDFQQAIRHLTNHEIDEDQKHQNEEIFAANLHDRYETMGVRLLHTTELFGNLQVDNTVLSNRYLAIRLDPIDPVRGLVGNTKGHISPLSHLLDMPIRMYPPGDDDQVTIPVSSYRNPSAASLLVNLDPMTQGFGFPPRSVISGTVLPGGRRVLVPDFVVGRTDDGDLSPHDVIALAKFAQDEVMPRAREAHMEFMARASALVDVEMLSKLYQPPHDARYHENGTFAVEVLSLDDIEFCEVQQNCSIEADVSFLATMPEELQELALQCRQPVLNYITRANFRSMYVKHGLKKPDRNDIDKWGRWMM